MRRFLIVFTLLCVGFSMSLADVEIPTWGWVGYDSTWICIEANDTATIVDVVSRMDVHKLVSDDYLLTFSRLSALGILPPDGAEAEVSDSLCRFEVGGGLLDLEFLSRCALEDSMIFTVHNRSVYDRSQCENVLSRLFYFQRVATHNEDSAWSFPDIEGLVYFLTVPYVVNIKSNQQLAVRQWARNGWGNVQRGLNFSLSGQMLTSWDSLAHYNRISIQLDGVEGVTDTLSDGMIYQLTPEVRRVVPDLILEDDVTISLSYLDEASFGYYQLAEIRLNPDMACTLSPMWLWYPNDETNGSVTLFGLRAQGAYGQDQESYCEEPLEIRVVEGEEPQNGLMIKLPSLETKRDWWPGYFYWSDPRLRVVINQEHTGKSARFILVTAPIDPSRISFSIPNWGDRFLKWESPFEYNRIDEVMGRQQTLTFHGLCAEPGIAQVWWGDPHSTPPEESLPSAFALTSAYPNPFNSTAVIDFDVPADQSISLAAYNTSGQKVADLAEEFYPAGRYHVVWQADNLPAGVYFLRLTGEEGVRTMKVALVR